MLPLVAVNHYEADFSVKGRGYPPIPLSFLGRMAFRFKRRGVPPNSTKENSAKKQVYAHMTDYT